MRTNPFSLRLVVLAAVFLAGAGSVGAGQALQCIAVEGELFEPAADEVAQAVREVLDRLWAEAQEPGREDSRE